MIKLSTKSRYGMRIMVRMAMLGANTKMVRKQAVAEAEGISPDYVEQILARLRAAGLVRSYRGVNGGFALARDPAKITAAAVFEATEGAIALAPCLYEECGRSRTCATKTLWRRTSEVMARTLAETTVADMARDAADLDKNQTSSFTI